MLESKCILTRAWLDDNLSNLQSRPSHEVAHCEFWLLGDMFTPDPLQVKVYSIITMHGKWERVLA